MKNTRQGQVVAMSYKGDKWVEVPRGSIMSLDDAKKRAAELNDRREDGDHNNEFLTCYVAKPIRPTR